MKKLELYCLQRRSKPKSRRGKSEHKRINLLNQCFNPPLPNEVWAGDITYIKTAQGWRYLAVVMDLYSRKIVSWQLNDHMKTDLVIQVLQKAYTLRQPRFGCVFHSDQGSQYTSNDFQTKINQLNMRSSMSSVGACYDNAVVERFFGSLKHEGLGTTRMMGEDQLRAKIAKFMRYYNMERLHSGTNGMSPFDFEDSQIKVSAFA